MHIRSHQKVSSELEEGNMLADREVKDAAKGEVRDETTEAALIPDKKISIEGKPVYNKKDKKLIKAEKVNYNQEAWAVTEEGKPVVPSYLLWSLVQKEHEKTHWGIEALYSYLKERIIARELQGTVIQIFENPWWSGEVPEDWKTENVTPVFIKSKKKDPGNYWPVALPQSLKRYLFTKKENAAGSYQLPDMSEGVWKVYVPAGMLQGELLGLNTLSTLS
ncbi:hypothetical protein HGM15179_013437 [Zosterops borbonicus]|uniref:Uncharacterized protein n=1 Tax=Zosterops borbonicus TaxID=364589 RepID=A0A8K1G816_9PASS|nr:hypothetical protein HGM15179_013437 [Zosterops borbonicus]